MFAAFPLLALASLAAAAPIASDVMATVSSALSLPNTTQTNNATWYYQNGNAGACGLYSEDTDLVVGLPLEFYNATSTVSAYCGSYVVITNVLNNETVTSRVADASGTKDILSLSQATYKVLLGSDSDLNTVTWRFANETETAEAKASIAGSAFPSSTASSTSAAAYTSVSEVAAAAAEETTTHSSKAATTEAPEKTTTTTKSTTAYTAPKTTTTTKYVAPTTTTQAYKAATTTKASSSSSGGTYSGQATYFYQNGVAGACGSVNSDSAYIVALDSAMYGGGSHCGSSVRITGNGKTITARVADECPTCASSGSLDLSVGAFTALASTDAGVVSISWSWA